MVQVIVEQRIDRPKAVVWQTLAAFSDVADANPYVLKSYPANGQSTGYGAIRHCELNRDGSQYSEEQITQWTEGEGYQIKMVGGTNPPPVDDLVMHLSVEALDGQSSVIRMSFDYKPRWGLFGQILNRIVIRRMLRQLGRNIMTGYRVHIETGQTIQSMDMMHTLAASAS